MHKREVLGRARTPEGGVLLLYRIGRGLEISTDGQILMSSRAHGSEEAMAKIACHHVREHEAPRVLVGGLGLGYTLRAALDRLPGEAKVVCSELMEAIVGWHAGPLGPLADHPLEDPRVTLALGDVVELIQDSRDEAAFDALLLDVDNGPLPMTVVSNWWLYAPVGVAALYEATRPGGILAVWSAFPDEPFADRLKAAGYEVEVVEVSAQKGKRNPRGRGERHHLFLGRRPQRPGPLNP